MIHLVSRRSLPGCTSAPVARALPLGPPCARSLVRWPAQRVQVARCCVRSGQPVCQIFLLRGAGPWLRRRRCASLQLARARLWRTDAQTSASKTIEGSPHLSGNRMRFDPSKSSRHPFDGNVAQRQFIPGSGSPPSSRPCSCMNRRWWLLFHLLLKKLTQPSISGTGIGPEEILTCIRNSYSTELDQHT